MTILRRRRSRGQSLAEFALVLPMFLLLIFAIVDLGRYVYSNNALSNAAREAARVGSVTSRPTCSAGTRDACINETARERITGVALKAGVATSGAQTTPGVYTRCYRWNGVSANPTIAANGTASGYNSIAFASCRGGDTLVVRLNSDFDLLTPLIAQFLGSQDLHGQAIVTVN
jgi:Flp pilus assembly protein TadG